jgi:hypothetical protein
MLMVELVAGKDSPSPIWCAARITWRRVRHRRHVLLSRAAYRDGFMPVRARVGGAVRRDRLIDQSDDTG